MLQEAPAIRQPTFTMTVEEEIATYRRLTTDYMATEEPLARITEEIRKGKEAMSTLKEASEITRNAVLTSYDNTYAEYEKHHGFSAYLYEQLQCIIQNLSLFPQEDIEPYKNEINWKAKDNNFPPIIPK